MSDARYNTKFNFHSDSYRFNLIQFELSNALETFQGVLENFPSFHK